MTQPVRPGPTDTGTAPRLVVRNAGREWVLRPGQEVTVGRADDAGIRIADNRVSRQHGRIEWEGDAWVLRAAPDRLLHTQDGPSVQVRVDREVTVRLADPAGPPLELQVVAEHDPTAGASTAGGVALTIGRDPDCDIVLDDPLVSRRHALVTVGSDGAMTMRDLGSRHRTVVNGAARTTALITEGDLLSVGMTDLLVAGGTLRPQPRGAATPLALDDVSFRVRHDLTLIDHLDLELSPGELLAVIGPSGAGKSTLLALMRGAQAPTEGQVLLDGHDLGAHYEALKQRIGHVPQDDVVHRHLTVRTALDFAARLRLSDDLTPGERAARVEAAIADLDLGARADTRIGSLSGGQRKRVSIGMELLTSPSLLALDEPTSGLDPHLDRQVMKLLRQLADSGRSVVVVTHSVANLDVCDRVLLLAPGGRPAYLGAPSRLVSSLDRDDHTEVFEAVAADPDAAAENFRKHSTARRRRLRGASPPAARPPSRRELWWQVRTLTLRHLRLVLADRAYAGFVLALPLLLGLLSMAVPGSSGFAPPAPGDADGSGASQLLVVVILAAVFMGTASSARECVAERPIFRREWAAGLSARSYLAAKVAAFAVLSLVQTSLLVSVVLSLEPGPEKSLFLPAPVMLWVTVAATTFASSMFGLLISAVARSTEQVMPMLVLSVMVQLVLCGGLTPVTDRTGLSLLAVLAPARWGYAAGASVVDLRALVPTVPDDSLWAHGSGQWLVDLVPLLVLSAVFAGLAWARTERERR